MSWRSDQPMYLKARDRICNRTWNFTVDESHNASHAPTDFDNTIGANKTDSTVRMGKTETSFLLGNHTITQSEILVTSVKRVIRKRLEAPDKLILLSGTY